MKLIGHVSTAVLAAAPVITYRAHAPELAAPELSDWHLLWWVGIWATAPDLDILLSRFTPIKHRGFASHSLWTALAAGGLVLGLWAFVHHPPAALLLHLPQWLFERLPQLAPAAPWVCPLTGLLAFLAVGVHLLGDGLTKTGVPLLAPNRMWHVPIIGGHAAFDNYFLNAIPLAAAGYMLFACFGLNPGALRGLGRWRDLLSLVGDLIPPLS